MNFRQSMLISLIVLAGLSASVPRHSTRADWSVPLYYDRELARQGFPSPLVHLRIGNHEAAFIVDTGAGVNTFATWFAQEARLNVKDSTAAARGSTGDETKVQVVSGVSGVLENRIPVRFEEAIVVDFPTIFESSRLGGLLSPQLLSPEGWAAVLDLRVPNLTFKPFDSAVTELGFRRIGNSEGTHVCTNRGSPFINRLYGIDVTVSGIKGAVVLDTGATRTLIAANSRIGQRLAEHSVEGEQSRGIGGTIQKNRSISNVKLHLAGQEIALDSIALGDSSSDCGPDGLVGMDVLKSCVLVLDASRVSLKCGKE